MELPGISEKIASFLKQYNYLTNTNANLHFLVKCIFLKYLSDNQRIDFGQNEKNIRKNFTLDYFIELWQGNPSEENFWEKLTETPLPLGDAIWDWLNDFVTAAPTFEGENPVMIGALYEECIHLSHKKNQGIFYTPDNLAEFMAVNLLKKNKIGKDIDEFRVLDPACGSGSLLSASYDQIFDIFGDGKSLSEKNTLHQLILEKCLFGIDKDPMACLVTRLVLVLKGKNYVKPLGIQCGDILIEDLVPAGSVDAIIGNPPYVGHKEIDCSYMKSLKVRYPEVYQDKGDLSYCFINRGWELLKPGGRLLHITSRYFLEAYYAKPLRHFLKNNFAVEEIIDFNGLRIIPGVGVDPAIIKVQKQEKVSDDHCVTVKRFYIKNHKVSDYSRLINSLNGPDDNELAPWEAFEVKQKSLKDDLWRLYSPMTRKIIEKIEEKAPFTLDNVVQSFQGIITGNDKAFIFNNTNDTINDFDENQLKPWIKNKDIGVFTVAQPQKKILYTNGIEDIETYPRVIDHLEKYKPKLLNRRECQNGKLPWHFIQWGRDPQHFNGRKIVFPYKANKNRFAIDDQKCYFSADVYGLILKPRLYHGVTEEFLVILLNSQLYNYYFKSFAKKLGDKLYEYYPNTLLKLGIPDITEENTKLFKEFYDKIEKLMDKGNTAELSMVFAEIDDWLYQYFNLSEAEIMAVENE
ncbi:Eco57I restriction-modification methylase domain-containing protein [Acetobacterium bakii]|uniref:Eco57I restriction-modification methylase domain-containing protein n=1 Tax=Acetobacterium bakii TaxID=52689 RepID=UPI00068024B3|nr:N-6 DNA methylase [Acetobacterium bakii]